MQLHKRVEDIKREYQCFVSYSTMHYLSKEQDDDLPFSKIIINPNTLLYNFWRHKLKLNIPETWVSASVCTNYVNKAYQGQKPAYEKMKRTASGTAVGNAVGDRVINRRVA